MNIFIDNRGGTPIYEQIYTQIKAYIVGGGAEDNELLPSIRNLAKDLRVSVITTKRAYDELEREGFIYTVAGKGCFVAPKDPALLREEHLRSIEEHMRHVRALAAACGLSREELREMYDVLEDGE